MSKISYNKLIQNIKECQLHILRLKYALKNSIPFFPINVDIYNKLSNRQIEHIDQLIYRYTKLQDSMGLRLFPSILEWLGEEVVTKSFKDRLNRLEQLGILRSTNEWNILRELRNQLAHEYPDEKDHIVEVLNEVHKSIPLTIEIFKQITKILKRKGLKITGNTN